MSVGVAAGRLAEDPMRAVDYEAKSWGTTEVRPSPTYLGGLRLRYCLEDLRSVSGRVLEIGCGGGGMSRAIRAGRPDLEVCACDLSSKMVRLAKQEAGQVEYLVSDAHGLPLACAQFDAVVIMDVLEHLANPEAVIAEVGRVLKPGGLFHLYVPLEGDLRCAHGFLRRLGWRAKERLIGHIQHFTAGELLRLCRRAGFTLRVGRWSSHMINQIVDVAYFTWLELAGRKVEISVEGYVSSNADRLLARMVGLAKTVFAVTCYFESRLLGRIPGAGGHFGLVRG